MSLLFEILFLFFTCWGDAEPKVALFLNPQNEQKPIALLDIIKTENIPTAFILSLENPILSSNEEEWNSLSTLEILKTIKSLFSEYEDDCRCRIQWVVVQTKKIRKPENFSLDIFQEKLIEKLKKKCSQCEYTLSSISLVRGVVPETYSMWELESDAQNSKGLSMIRVYFDGKALDPLVVQTYIRVRKPVAILKRPAMRGELIDSSLFSYELQDVTFEKRALADQHSVEGKELKRSLNQGHWLSLDDLAGRQNIRLGQPVIVEVQSGSILIEMSGVAQRDGKVGERIPIRVTKTQKQIMGEVIADARVRL